MNAEALQSDSNSTPTKPRGRKYVLELSHAEARDFFLKTESYCNLELPPYFGFGELIKDVHSFLSGGEPPCLIDKKNPPQDYDNANYTIPISKDGKYAWRPIQLTHPALYVSLVHCITEKDNWETIIGRFKKYSQIENISCLSIPIVSQSKETDKSEQMLHWWGEVEQKSIELALDYDCLLETDITDCYGAIYTHSIAWALHGKTQAKKERNNKKLIGNQIDKQIRDIQHGQTNGIPQGSVLMDFVAEMVLGYADLKLSEKIKKLKTIKNYRILRYRDDYRIFVNGPRDGELIMKLLTEVMHSLGLKINASKTKPNYNIVRASIKQDKLSWLFRKQNESKSYKHLLIIHDHALNFPNPGSLNIALGNYHKRLLRTKKHPRKPFPLISIAVDIAYHNPKTYPICFAILSKLLRFVAESDRTCIVQKILTKFSKIPNTGYAEIWLQRVSHPTDPSILYREPLCQLVSGNAPRIWNSDWVTSSDFREVIDVNKIINRECLDSIAPVVPFEEVKLFLEDYQG